MEELILERINKTLKKSNIKKITYAENLGWTLSKLSRVLNGETSLTVDNATILAQCLGYPLEAFTNQNEFNLEKFDRLHQIKPLRECIADSLSWTSNIERMRNAVLIEFPKTIRKVLKLNPAEFVIEGEIREKKEAIVAIDNTIKNAVSYSPQITLRYKEENISSTHLVLGYWISSTRNFMTLSISYLSDPSEDPQTRNAKLTYFRDLIKAEIPAIADQNIQAQIQNLSCIDESHELIDGELASKIYHFDSSKMDETTLTTDLLTFFQFYQRLVQIYSKMMAETFWTLYSKTLSESAPSPSASVSSENVMKTIENITGIYEQDPRISAKSLEKAGGVCESCGTATTFTDKEGKQYFETHPLIPLRFAPEGQTYDQVPNLVCLCPICHKKLEFAQNTEREEMLVALYYKRKEELEKAGIHMSLAKLLNLYQIN